MNRDEFLDRLSKTPRTWEIRFLGQIIRGPLDCCPITGTDGPGIDAINWQDSATRLDLSPQLAVTIMKAADNDPLHDINLRADLLRACGLEDA